MREKKKKLLKPKEDKQGKYVQCPECKVKIYGDRLLGFHHCQHCGWDSEDNCGKEYAPQDRVEIESRRLKVVEA